MIKLQVHLIPPSTYSRPLNTSLPNGGIQHQQHPQPLQLQRQQQQTLGQQQGTPYYPNSTLNGSSTPIGGGLLMGQGVGPYPPSPYYLQNVKYSTDSSIKKFLHITNASNTMQDVCLEIQERFLRLYPDEEPLSILKIQDKDEFDLDPTYTAGMVFDTSNIALVILENEFSQSQDATSVSNAFNTSNNSSLLKSLSGKRRLDNDLNNVVKKSRTGRDSANSANSSYSSSSIWMKAPISSSTTGLSARKHPLQHEHAETDGNEPSLALPAPEDSDLNNTVIMKPKKTTSPKMVSPIIAKGSPKRITSGMLTSNKQPDLSKHIDESDTADTSQQDNFNVLNDSDDYHSDSNNNSIANASHVIKTPSANQVINVKKRASVPTKADVMSRKASTPSAKQSALKTPSNITSFNTTISSTVAQTPSPANLPAQYKATEAAPSKPALVAAEEESPVDENVKAIQVTEDAAPTPKAKVTSKATFGKAAKAKATPKAVTTVTETPMNTTAPAETPKATPVTVAKKASSEALNPVAAPEAPQSTTTKEAEKPTPKTATRTSKTAAKTTKTTKAAKATKATKASSTATTPASSQPIQADAIETPIKVVEAPNKAEVKSAPIPKSPQVNVALTEVSSIDDSVAAAATTQAQPPAETIVTPSIETLAKVPATKTPTKTRIKTSSQPKAIPDKQAQKKQAAKATLNDDLMPAPATVINVPLGRPLAVDTPASQSSYSVPVVNSTAASVISKSPPMIEILSSEDSEMGDAPPPPPTSESKTATVTTRKRAATATTAARSKSKAAFSDSETDSSDDDSEGEKSDMSKELNLDHGTYSKEDVMSMLRKGTVGRGKKTVADNKAVRKEEISADVNLENVLSDKRRRAAATAAAAVLTHKTVIKPSPKPISKPAPKPVPKPQVRKPQSDSEVDSDSDSDSEDESESDDDDDSEDEEEADSSKRPRVVKTPIAPTRTSRTSNKDTPSGNTASSGTTSNSPLSAKTASPANTVKSPIAKVPTITNNSVLLSPSRPATPVQQMDELKSPNALTPSSMSSLPKLSQLMERGLPDVRDPKPSSIKSSPKISIKSSPSSSEEESSDEDDKEDDDSDVDDSDDDSDDDESDDSDGDDTPVSVRSFLDKKRAGTIVSKPKIKKRGNNGFLELMKDARK